MPNTQPKALKTNLDKLPKQTYTNGQTPLHKLDKIQKHLGPNCPGLYIKRDDRLGLTEGGNKTRKLEFLVADALKQGCDTLITCGAIQSNHCRLTLSAANKEGLDCHLVLEERIPGTYSPKASGNNLLYYLLGAKKIVVVDKDTDLNEEMQKIAEELKAQGKNPYIIPGGGSNALGSSGYVSCALELQQQCDDLGISPTTIVVPSGSAGTHAGMAVGYHQSGVNIHGISVRFDEATQQERVHQLANEITLLLETGSTIPKEEIQVFDQFIGEGYSIPTQGTVDAITLLARLEGILLDPVYTGKTFNGFVERIFKGEYASTETLIFLHTGGSPALYSYAPLWVS